MVVTIAFFFYVESPPIEIVSHSKDAKSAYEAFMRIADKNGVTDHGITEEEIQNIYSQHRKQLERDRAHHFTFIDVCKYPSLRSDFIRVSAGFFADMLLFYAPLVLVQKMIPNVFTSNVANGLSMIATIPFLPYFH